MIFDKNLLKKINFVLYTKKHLFIYIIIGFLSVLFELTIRKFTKLYITSEEIYLHLMLINYSFNINNYLQNIIISLLISYPIFFLFKIIDEIN